MRRTERATQPRTGRLVITRWSAIQVFLGLMFSVSCHADGAAIAKTGAGAVPACQTCHGAAGEGLAQAGFPRLAGLGAPYMQRQLAAFADGTRVNDVMRPIAKALSDAQRVDVSTYYAALPAPAAAVSTAPASSMATSSAPVSAGSALATRGRWADQLPACEQCHGPGGRGVGPDFPPLAGQSASYLANQLNAWKTGARPPGPMGLMSVVARKLSEAEVLAIAEHYAALPAKEVR
ncbi:c-type cytochrome [Hydrogenophaga sp.]|uniref:c-type cytochrome n=1 Tax=Hydrogenophaga sp. TaxID=1904254 RepID=UPI003FA533AE